jgi:UDP-N-acetylglucosamine 1-carboxyvinyltransferase
MDRIVVRGGRPLRGHVRVSGSKNAALPILAATLMAEGETVLENVPNLRDVETILQILRGLGVEGGRTSDGSIRVHVVNEDLVQAPYELVSTMRASVCVLGPLLARRKRARVSLPGGCVFGVRPIDLHLKGLRALGAHLEVRHGDVIAETERLKGAEVYLGGPYGSTVLGTANVMMAATLAEGRTVIEGAASEPEVADLARFLNEMGARIQGAGTHRIVIDGVKRLHGTRYRVIPDRIEAGTFLVAAAMTRGEVTVEGAVPEHLAAVLDKLQEIGVRLERHPEHLKVYRNGPLHPTDVVTLPFPGFPTDLQAQFMALLSLVGGVSVISEKVYPDRFIHAAELNRMGANIRKEGDHAILQGVQRLSVAPVMASDLRASAALVLAGLVAQGETEVHRVYHLDRGYERIEEKFRALGADIDRVKDDREE